MNGQFVPGSLEALSGNWQKLKASLYDCDEIRTEFFLEIFKNTEECLRKCVASDVIDKQYIPLIADAYAFVDVRIDDKNIPMQTAQILTERLLYQYVVNTEANEQTANRVTVYLLKNKRQFTIDLTNAGLAFSIVEEALQV